MSSRTTAYTVAALAGIIGTVSLLWFGIFLTVGSRVWVPLGFGGTGALAVDGALCLLFFVQHSVMIRGFFRDRLAKAMPASYHGAVYTIASGVALLVLVIFWQRSDIGLVELRGAPRWAWRCVGLAGVIVFLWGARALRSFEPFGINAVLDDVRGTVSRGLPLTVRGAFRWVRHPLYLAMLLLMWSYPTLTADRLLFNGLWTVWVIVGIKLEERDLATAFGDAYHDYQRTVPMLFPWRIPKS